MKKLVKEFFFRLYMLGYREAKHRKLAADRLQKSQAAVIGQDVNADEGNIKNYRNKRECIHIGNRSVLQGELLLFKHGGQISIGEDCYIGPGSRVWSAKKISIGNRVLISHNVNILDNISHPLDASERHQDFTHIFFKGGFQEKVDLKEAAITIGDDAWIGFNAIILKGVTIGKGAVIGAASVITDDVPDNAIVVGNPQRIVRYNI
jgi:acetyltransferase-like isoleucine patch superfamily enzyme